MVDAAAVAGIIRSKIMKTGLENHTVLIRVAAHRRDYRCLLRLV